MNILFLGTAAAEGIPAFWCECECCKKSRTAGGRALRTRSQAIIDGRLLIDFPPDTLSHIYKEGIDLLDIRHCIVTHSHRDHLYPEDICNIRPGFSHAPEGYRLTFHGTKIMAEMLSPHIDPISQNSDIVGFEPLVPFLPCEIDGYTVTALPAIHDPKSGPVFYQISDGDKTIIYGNDTHYFHDDVWEYWEKIKPHFDLVSLDCTNAYSVSTYTGHMGLHDNIKVRERMLSMGIADESTVFVCNHFSHNGKHAAYDDFVPLAAKEGFLVSFDGMKLSV